jgi:hypothetical protein
MEMLIDNERLGYNRRGIRVVNHEFESWFNNWLCPLRRQLMEDKQIATLKFTVDPKALQEIISAGRLFEFATTAAAEAAAQINAQVVEHVASVAVQPRVLAELSVNTVFIDGDRGFGTHPPGPHRPTVKLEF